MRKHSLARQETPSERDVATARALLRALKGGGRELRLALGRAKAFSLPPPAVRLLIDGLGEIAAGRKVVLASSAKELTTEQAARLLSVSRPFLIALLDKGEVPYRKVGTHRRLKYEDVIAFKEAIDAKRRRSLKALARQAQDLKMGY